MRHTEGPWNYAQWSDGDNAIIDAAGDGRICEMVTNQTDEQRDANAQLIVAAPCIFKACKELITAYDTGSDLPIGALRSAIARAEGND